jgi:hypothetical protein
VITLSLPANVMTLLPGLLPLIVRLHARPVMVNRKSLFEKVSLAVTHPRQSRTQTRAGMVKEY